LPGGPAQLLQRSDAALVVQNVSLFRAGAGLSTVMRALFHRRALAVALRLSQPERSALAQTPGLPASAS
jgi:hypothetical protein